MSDITIDVRNLDKVRRQLLKLGDAAVNDVKAVNLAAAEVIATEAKRLAPVRDGDLKGDIRASGTKASGIVRAGRKSIPYAGPINFGWPNRPAGKWGPGRGPRGGPIAASNFMGDALKNKKAELLLTYEDEFRRLFRKHT